MAFERVTSSVTLTWPKDEYSSLIRGKNFDLTVQKQAVLASFVETSNSISIWNCSNGRCLHTIQFDSTFEKSPIAFVSWQLNHADQHIGLLVASSQILLTLSLDLPFLGSQPQQTIINTSSNEALVPLCWNRNFIYTKSKYNLRIFNSANGFQEVHIGNTVPSIDIMTSFNMGGDPLANPFAALSKTDPKQIFISTNLPGQSSTVLLGDAVDMLTSFENRIISITKPPLKLPLESVDINNPVNSPPPVLQYLTNIHQSIHQEPNISQQQHSLIYLLTVQPTGEILVDLPVALPVGFSPSCSTVAGSTLFIANSTSPNILSWSIRDQRETTVFSLDVSPSKRIVALLGSPASSMTLFALIGTIDTDISNLLRISTSKSYKDVELIQFEFGQTDPPELPPLSSETPSPTLQMILDHLLVMNQKLDFICDSQRKLETRFIQLEKTVLRQSKSTSNANAQ